MTKAWIGFFALAIPLLYAVITGQFHARRKCWSLAILLAGVIILPWHLWQIWIYGKSFLHDYFVVNLFGRIASVLEENQHGPLFYFIYYGTDFPLSVRDICGRPHISGPHGLHGPGSTGKKFSCLA